jgi:hypothetical protein
LLRPNERYFYHEVLLSAAQLALESGSDSVARELFGQGEEAFSGRTMAPRFADRRQKLRDALQRGRSG